MEQSKRKSVRAWREEVVIPTYAAQAPDPNPMFLEKRVYQGSSGKVYPNPFTDKVSTELRDQKYQAAMLENEYVQLMILPEIGGRIHAALDKTNGYDFFYRQHVIKPALVGLLGPWISGGVEFNWPQHHRPSTYMPVHVSIESSADGSCTVWLSEHEPMNRLKGMVGICLHPGKSLIEAKVRLFNRTPLPQTFLWWANVAVRVHDDYQAFFPPDVEFVADHAKRAMSSFPVARNTYYGVDYSAGVDLSWYKNIPVPTSYMVTKSKYDFFGGYDHARRAGFVHCSNHHLAPGKKMWTWGNSEFGEAWERNLTDADGPYIELMAGAYTDNQPDFSWLQPYELRAFSQFWYPIQEIGLVRNANTRFAIGLEAGSTKLRAGVSSSEAADIRLVILDRGEAILDRKAAVAPSRPLVAELPWDGRPEDGIQAQILDDSGRVLLEYVAEPRRSEPIPGPAEQPASPSQITTNEELYLTGLHLEQYRHATRSPVPYWEEGLRRDPGDARLNNAMGIFELRRGNYEAAASYFRAAIHRLTARNPNPSDGEAFYNLGLALKYLGQLDDAYGAFYKCVWNQAWQSAGYYSLAAIDAHRLQFALALEHIEMSLRSNPVNLKARGLKSSLLRHSGQADEAERVVRETLAVDPLDLRSAAELFFLSDDTARGANELVCELNGDVQAALDLAYDYIHEGLPGDGYRLLREVEEKSGISYPMVYYTLSWIAQQLQEEAEAGRYAERAAAASPAYCFPSRLEEMIVLEAAVVASPQDGNAPYYLGNLYYDKRRHEDAIRCWRSSVKLGPSFSIPWRNLGIAEYNIHGDERIALDCYTKAFAANPMDARLLYEWDQLKKRAGATAAERIAVLEKSASLVAERDDLTVEYIALLNQSGKFQDVLNRLQSRRFHPWEGGEGQVSGQYVYAHMNLGRDALAKGASSTALEHFNAARRYPENLGEGKHPLTLERDIDYFSALAAHGCGEAALAASYWQQAARPLPGITHHTYYQALALRELGYEEAYRKALEAMLDHARVQLETEPQIDYFATSLPNFLLFEDDLKKRNEVDSLYLIALAELGKGNSGESAATLNKLLKLDQNHLGALEQLRWMDSATSTYEPQTAFHGGR